MRKILALILLSSPFLLAGQTFSGTVSKNDGFTSLDWEITFSPRAENYVLALYGSDPQLSPASDSYYSYMGVRYSLQDLGLSEWETVPGSGEFAILLQVYYKDRIVTTARLRHNFQRQDAMLFNNRTTAPVRVYAVAGLDKVYWDEFDLDYVSIKVLEIYNSYLQPTPDILEMIKQKATKPKSTVTFSAPSLSLSSSGSSSSSSGSSSGGGSSSSSSSSKSSSSSGSETTAPFTQAEMEEFRRSQRSQEEVMGELFLETYNTISTLSAEIQANRAQKQAQRAREQARVDAAYNKFLHEVQISENEYLRSVESYNAKLKDPSFVTSNIVKKIDGVLKAPTIPWSIFMANKSYVNFFGEHVNYIDKKLQVGYNIRNNVSEGSTNAFNGITAQFQKFVNVQNEQIYYWYGSEFLEHYDISLLLNENNIMTGLEIELDTRNFYRRKEISQYVADLKIALANDCIQISGNTYLTKDKLFVLDFEFLRMYDLRFFKPDTHFTMGAENVKKTFGLVLKGEPDDRNDKSNSKVTVAEVLPNSPMQMAGLNPGDIILKIDNIQVSKPYEVEMYLFGAQSTKTTQILLERNKKIETITVNK